MLESSDETGAGSRQLEVLDSEWEVVVSWVEDQSAVVDALLDAFRLVAHGDQRASCTGGVGVALFNASVLVEFVVVRLDFVDDDSPLALNVDGAQRLDVGCRAWAQVSFLYQLLQTIDRVGCVSDNVLVEG